MNILVSRPLHCSVKLDVMNWMSWIDCEWLWDVLNELMRGLWLIRYCWFVNCVFSLFLGFCISCESEKVLHKHNWDFVIVWRMEALVISRGAGPRMRIVRTNEDILVGLDVDKNKDCLQTFFCHRRSAGFGSPKRALAMPKADSA